MAFVFPLLARFASDVVHVQRRRFAAIQLVDAAPEITAQRFEFFVSPCGHARAEPEMNFHLIMHRQVVDLRNDAFGG